MRTFRRAVMILVMGWLLAYGHASLAYADQYGDRLQSESNRADSWFNFSSYTPTRFEEWSTGCHDSGRAGTYMVRSGWQDDRNSDGTYKNPTAPIIQSRWTNLPLPCYFSASPGTDGEAALIWRGPKAPGQYDYCDFWRVDWPGYWHGRWGGCANNDEFTQGPGGIRTFPLGMGVQGSRIAFFPGTITVADLRRGYANHVIEIEVPEACGYYVAPAAATDGSGTMSTNSRCFPYGVLVKAPTSAQCPSGATWFCGFLLRAAKDYGLMVTDQTHNTIAIRFENYKRKYAPWGTTNPYVQYMSGADCDKSQWRGCGNRLNQMWGFPWSSLSRAGA